MIFYLLNKSQKAIKAFPSEKLVEAKYTEGINEASKLTFSVPLESRLPDSAFFTLFQKPDSSDFLLFKINDETIENDRISYTGVDAAYDELKSYSYVKDIRPVKKTAKEILQRVLQGTRWQVGYVDSTDTIDTNFYYQPCLECIQKIAQLFNMELVFTYGFDSKYQKITSRKVNLYQQQGKRTGKRFEYGSNLLTVTREEDSQDIVTALVGRGKGEENVDEETSEATGGYGRRINFSDVVWSKANGDPVDKPAGKEYVEDVQATRVFGYDDGKPRIGIVTFEDIEDPVELLKATWASLKSSERPKVTFKASVTDVGNLGLGDTIAIIRHELGIEYFTRVFKVTHDLLNKQNNIVEMGDDLSGNSLTSYISNVDNLAQNAQHQAINATVQAESKSKNFYSTTKPQFADEGDNLFLNLGNGEFEHWVWHNHQWVFIQSTQDLANVKQNVEETQKDLNNAKAEIIKNHESNNEAISSLSKTVTGLVAKVDDSVNKSQIEQLSNQINAKVSKGDIIGQLNIEAGSTLIQNKKLYFDSDSVVFSGKAFIPDAAIANISADKINAGTLDAGKINVINLNADNIVAGSLSGKNINIDLNDGSFQSSSEFDKAFDSRTGGMLIRNGELMLTRSNWTDTNAEKDRPYMMMTQSMEHDTVIFGSKSISLSPFPEWLNWDQVETALYYGPFDGYTDDNGNYIQQNADPDFIGIGIERPLKTTGGFFGTKPPFAINIASGKMAMEISGKQINLETPFIKGEDQNGTYDHPYIRIGTAENDGFGINREIGPSIDIMAKKISLNFDTKSYSTGNSSNLFMNVTGTLYATTSATRFKRNIHRSFSTNYGDKLLSLPVATWIDKSEFERSKKKKILPKTYYGMIAEDLSKAGLNMLVTEENGTITGIQYDRIGVALIPVIKELKNKLEKLEGKLNEQSKQNRCK